MKKIKDHNRAAEVNEWEQDWENREEEENGVNMLREHILEVVENQLRDGKPAFVTDVFYSLQKKGLCRKEARIVIAGVLLEEIYHTLKEPGGHDEKRYEANLRRQNRQVTAAVSTLTHFAISQKAIWRKSAPDHRNG